MMHIDLGLGRLILGIIPLLHEVLINRKMSIDERTKIIENHSVKLTDRERSPRRARTSLAKTVCQLMLTQKKITLPVNEGNTILRIFNVFFEEQNYTYSCVNWEGVLPGYLPTQSRTMSLCGGYGYDAFI